MIPKEVKRKLLKELEKSGNILFACNKIGIDRSTFYRWRKESKEFKKLADEAVQRGRENMCDLAEHALLLNVKEKKMEAIKYVLSHYSKVYKPKQTSKVVIEHRRVGYSETNKDTDKAFEEIIKESEDRMTEEWLKLPRGQSTDQES